MNGNMSGETGTHLPPIRADGLRHWRVAGGVIIRGEEVLLVKNRRRCGGVDWSTPGGVIDPGETAVEGLSREVEEETGLRVGHWHGPLYLVEVHAPDAGFFLRAEAHLAAEVIGEVLIGDPDGIVVAAAFVGRSCLREWLVDAQPWVSEPLLAHLEDGVVDGRLFRYRFTGSGRRDRRVERL
jgi:8-oxo-dGTP diphosphatase